MFGSFWGVFGAGLVPLGVFGGEVGVGSDPLGVFWGDLLRGGGGFDFLGVLEADWKPYGGLGGGLDPIGGLGGWVLDPLVYI